MEVDCRQDGVGRCGPLGIELARLIWHDILDTAVYVGREDTAAAHAANGTKFCLITEADRSVTTVLLPEDY